MSSITGQAHRDSGRWTVANLRAILPSGGSLPDSDFVQRHRVIVWFLWVAIAAVVVYAVLAHGSGAARYTPELASLVIFASIAGWSEPSRKWRSVAASMGLLTASATLIDISGGLLELHFMFFVAIVILTLYEDWVPFLLAVTFVLIHHGVMGMIDPRAVFASRNEWRAPWLWAGIHAGFVLLAGIAGVIAWGLNERVRERMRATQAELEHIGLTDALTGLANRRRLMTDLARCFRDGTDASLVIFDLDGFKDYNDRFGHPAGDSLLCRLSASLETKLGDLGRAYRLGGDEFCVLADVEQGAELGERIAEWSEAFSERGEGFSISASNGAALIPIEARDPSEALRICDRRMYQLKHDRRASTATQTRDVLLAALAARHSELGDHVSSVALTSQCVGVDLGLSTSELQDLRYAAELHDIGKVAIPDTILSKPGPLDEEEWEFMRRHTVIGERILAASPALSRVAQIVRATHERFDGGGYPDRLRGESIPLSARIVCVCDAYDAMTTLRPYRTPVPHAGALEELRRCAGSQFDPLVVESFIKVADALPEESEGDRIATAIPRAVV
jgi:diguanylate cyclase (GGDEF)-like protein